MARSLEQGTSLQNVTLSIFRTRLTERLDPQRLRHIDRPLVVAGLAARMGASRHDAFVAAWAVGHWQGPWVAVDWALWWRVYWACCVDSSGKIWPWPA